MKKPLLIPVTFEFQQLYIHSHFSALKVCTLKNNTDLNSSFCLIKSSEIVFIFLPAFYLNMWLMTSKKNFEEIAILKIWQLAFFKGHKTHFGELPLNETQTLYSLQEIPVSQFYPITGIGGNPSNPAVNKLNLKVSWRH